MKVSVFESANVFLLSLDVMNTGKKTFFFSPRVICVCMCVFGDPQALIRWVLTAIHCQIIYLAEEGGGSDGHFSILFSL